MLTLLHVSRWTLGGTIAVVAGLAASAEPLAPTAGEVARPDGSILASLSAVDPTSSETDGDSLAADLLAAPMAEAPLRPRLRPLGSAPADVVVRSGATIRPEPRPIFTAEARWDGTAHQDRSGPPSRPNG